MGIDYDEADVYQRRHGTTAGTYPDPNRDLDQFGRVIKSRWTKDLSTDMDFVSVDVSYDENSNPLTTEDNIYAAGFDVKYAIDGHILDSHILEESGAPMADGLACPPILQYGAVQDRERGRSRSGAALRLCAARSRATATSRSCAACRSEAFP